MRSVPTVVCIAFVLTILLATPACAQVVTHDGLPYLFNGKDLSGWKLRDEGGRNMWKAERGVLINQAPGTDLVTELTFTDQELHVEFRVPRGGNSGVYLQGRYEIQVSDAFGGQVGQHMCGAIYGKIAPKVNPARPAGEWQSFDVRFVAPRTDREGKVTQRARITVIWNGVTVIDDAEIDGLTGGALDEDVGKPGPLMLQGDHTAVEYRNIRYCPLRAGWRDESAFVSLFDGKTLNGWSVGRESHHGSGGKWEVQGGVITGTQDPPGNGGLLLSEKLYGDFEIRMELNPDFGIDSGLFLRSDAKGNCYQATVDYRKGGEVGTLYGEGCGGWLQANPMWTQFYRHNDWNEIRAVVTGQPPHIQYWLNGNLTVDYYDTEERLPPQGHIALQIHRGGDWEGKLARFRNIRILPLATEVGRHGY